ncbi:MAG TPA: MBL fold metallo-hydrolase, partial [Methanocorpusculum sp.]|nr:MBL fold metallo-hydrolase [Methanocorpusculum sp.]
MLKAVKIKNGVYWVGAIDWNIRDYHGYTLPGTTYNAYLVIGDKVALIDGTYPGHEWQMIERIESVLPLEKIDYIVANHIEIDHSGSLPLLSKKLPNVPIYMTEIAKKG